MRVLGQARNSGNREQGETRIEELADIRKRQLDAEHELVVVPIELADQPLYATRRQQPPRQAAASAKVAGRPGAGKCRTCGRQCPREVVDPRRQRVAGDEDGHDIGDQSAEPNRRQDAARLPLANQLGILERKRHSVLFDAG
jgi:hypothetical protein